MNEFLLKKVSDKLEKEQTAAKPSRCAQVIIKPVKKALLDFCKQEDEFAQAIIESNKTLGDCCEQIVNGTGNAISDLEAYSQAVQFYFPGADVRFEMKIDLCASVNSGAETKSLEVSLMDLI